VLREFRIPRTAESHHRLRHHLRLEQVLAFPFPGQDPLVLPPALAYLVQAYFDGFGVQHAVPSVGPLPDAGGAQLGRGAGGLDGQAVEVLEVIVGDEPGVAAGAECAVVRTWRS